jgi:serine/threonine-protein kinase
MALTAGTRIGSYEILSAIGAGGMGEVYRARDTKLGRDIAVKALPDLFQSNPERVARFEREAQLLAALSHPNIAAIYGVQEAAGSQFLVLEYIDGESLAERIEKRRALPLDEALAIARQLVDALETAHEKGIIHRDLKPANIMVTADERVKVLDFGLAKALENPAAQDAHGLQVSHSPTMTLGATAAGVILGTAAYMSPEQAKGRAADKRSDVWAFGCVFYEMLTGRRAFDGEDASDTLATVLKSEPDWNAFPPEVPPHLRTLIKRCLEKDRKARIPDISVVRFLMLDTPASAPAPPTAAVEATPSARRWIRAMPWALAAASLTLAVTAVVLWAPWREAPTSVPLRLSTELGGGLEVVRGQSAVALSPDGRTLAFVGARTPGEGQLYVRRLEQLQPTALSGTEGATDPFFSPDGQWIGFFDDGKLKKISVTGGATVTLCDVAQNGRGGSWTDDGSIVFGAVGNLMRVSSAGGNPEPLTTLGDGELSHAWPQVLPGGKGVLYSVYSGEASFDNANIVVQRLAGGDRKILQRGGYHARYVPSGHLTYIHEGTLFAAPFDLDRLETSGQAAPIVEGVVSYPSGVGPRNGAAQFALSDTGALVYVPGESTSSNSPIHWLAPDEKTQLLRPAPANWSSIHFAPDGRRVAMHINDGTQSDIWIYEWDRDILSRLTSDPATDENPVWTPDGRRIVFASRRWGNALNLYWQRSDGGEAQRLTESTNNQWPASWHPDGKLLAFWENNPKTGSDLMLLSVEGDEATGWKAGQPRPFLNDASASTEPMFSPDGRWLAYFSNETTRVEVYVRPYPGPGGEIQISTGGANAPAWSRSRRELLFRGLDGTIMVAPYSIEGDVFRPEKPRPWTGTRVLGRSGQRVWDLHPDGQRAAGAVADESTVSRVDKVVLVLNFFDELRRIASPENRN